MDACALIEETHKPAVFAFLVAGALPQIKHCHWQLTTHSRSDDDNVSF